MYRARVTMYLAAMVVGLAFSASTASAGQPTKSVYWIDLMGTASKHPRLVYFTANSGSQVRGIGWNGWGRRRAVGRGTYLVTSPPPPGKKNPKGPARIVAWKPISCIPEFGSHKGKYIRVYRHAKMLRPVSGGGRKWVDISDYTGWTICR